MNVDTKAIREAIENYRIGKVSNFSFKEFISWLRQLLDENAMLNKQMKNVMEACNEQKEEIRSLRAGYTSANAKQGEELYFWEPYAENHLESLTGGVVIRAEWIRQLIAEEVGAKAKEIERLEKLVILLQDVHEVEKARLRTEIEQLQSDNEQLRRQISFLCPIADLDTITSLQTEKAHMADHIAQIQADKAAAVEALEAIRDNSDDGGAIDCAIEALQRLGERPKGSETTELPQPQREG